MFDLRKFERVWKKAGETPEFDGQCLWFDEGVGLWAVKNDYLRNETAAAIIRDWAVGFLVTLHSTSERHDGFPKFGHGHDGRHRVYFDNNAASSTDRTEALYFACCKALNIEP